jgi:UDP-N-acetylglucosamine 2-epimerase
MPDRRLKVLSIFGTRPEAVKMAPVIQRLAAAEQIESQVCVTAQHRQMLDQILQLFDITPDFDLDLMRPDQSLPSLAAAVFSELSPVIEQARPDWVLVQGDTTTVMAASILTYFHRCRLGHIEAGLRTGDKWQPFPEEINRRLASVVTDLHFAPTRLAAENLRREGIPEARIKITGNTVIDALQQTARRPYQFESGPLTGIPEGRRVILVTAHRRENFGEPLLRILEALRTLAHSHPEIMLVYPVHLNPHVRQPAHQLLGRIRNILLTDPLDYLPMVHLMKRAYLVLTDSGGLQEEAPALGIPVLVMRQVTERPEALQAGTAILVGTQTERIVAEAEHLLNDSEAYARMARAVNPFGDGHAAERIVDALLQAKRIPPDDGPER